MDIQTRHRVELVNAKCNIVCAAEVILKKMDYGEDVGCCVDKLTSAVQLINRLDCYCFETPINTDEEVLSVFTYTVANNDYLDGTILQLQINGVQVAGVTISGTVPKPEAWTDILSDLGISFTSINNGSDSTFTITHDCNTTEIIALITKITTNEFVLTSVTTGACASSNPPCYNCFPVSRLPKMYALVKQLIA